MNVPVRFTGYPHRADEADFGAMLSMGYSYYAGLRPQRVAFARERFGAGFYDDQPRSRLALGYALSTRPSGLKPAPCLLVSRYARQSNRMLRSMREARARKVFG